MLVPSPFSQENSIVFEWRTEGDGAISLLARKALVIYCPGCGRQHKCHSPFVLLPKPAGLSCMNMSSFLYAFEKFPESSKWLSFSNTFHLQY